MKRRTAAALGVALLAVAAGAYWLLPIRHRPPRERVEITLAPLPAPTPPPAAPKPAAEPAAMPATPTVTAMAPAEPVAKPKPRAETLLPAPDPALVEQSPDGPLPMVGKDGRQPWQAYARPFDDTDKRPRIAVLVGGLGLDGALTRQAIDRLPAAVTLGFDPSGRQLVAEIEQARRDGHEVVLGLPMEPTDFPSEDPGPKTLLTTRDDEENLARLRWVLGRATGYVGVNCLFGSRFTASRQKLQPVLLALKQRGLMLIDDHVSEQSIAGGLARSLGMPWAVGERILDAEPSHDAIDKALADLEKVARKDGVALGIGSLYPVTLERIAAWADTLEAKGLVLAPTSAVAMRQPAPAMASQ